MEGHVIKKGGLVPLGIMYLLYTIGPISFTITDEFCKKIKIYVEATLGDLDNKTFDIFPCAASWLSPHRSEWQYLSVKPREGYRSPVECKVQKQGMVPSKQSTAQFSGFKLDLRMHLIDLDVVKLLWFVTRQLRTWETNFIPEMVDNNMEGF